MRRAALSLIVALLVVIAVQAVRLPEVGAWKCDRHPEQPTCTTTVPPTTEPVTYTVPSTTSTTVATTTTTTSSTTTTVAGDPYDPPQARRPIRFAG